MKAARLLKYGRVDSVAIEEIDAPSTVHGKILVRVHAAGVNPVDWKVRAGYVTLPLPLTLGGDLAGTVMEVGAGVSGFKKGDEVYGQAAVFNGGTGSFAEFDLADSSTIALKPKRLSSLEAAAIPLTGISALQALSEHMRLHKGQRILIHGGAGGIGTMAIQLAKHLGAHVATTVTQADFEYVQSLGADDIIDYQTHQFEDLISKYDAVLDTVGGDTYRRSFKVLKKGGTMVSMLESPNLELAKEHGAKVISQLTQVTTDRLAKLADLVDRMNIKVHIDKIFPLEQAVEALSYLEDKHAKGKVMITIGTVSH